MTELGDFQRPLSRAVEQLCRGFVVNYGRLAYKVTDISTEGPSVTSDLEKFADLKVRILSDPNANLLWKKFELQLVHERHYSFPSKVFVDIYPQTFVCSNASCRIIYGFAHLPDIRVRCDSCHSPLDQLTLVLVCRACGSMKEIFTKCPFCRAPIRLTEPKFALQWECTNPKCGAHPDFKGKGKRAEFYRRFDRTVNMWSRPEGFRCTDKCHDSSGFSPLDGPLFQTRAREKLFSSYKDSYITYAPLKESPRDMATQDDVRVYGFSKIDAGNYTVHTMVFGFDRYAKWGDRIRATKLRVEPFAKAGGGLDIYYRKMRTVGISLQLDTDIVEEIVHQYLPKNSDISGRRKDEFEYLKGQIKSEWTKVDGSRLNECGLSLAGDDLAKETLRRILIHTVKHALLVEAPRHCGLDYGEMGGYYKTQGKLSEGDKKLDNNALYIYDNTNYGSGVTFSLASREAFGDWLLSSVDRLECWRNRCVLGCKSCIFLPSMVCPSLNIGLNRELANAYFERVRERFQLTG